MRQELLLTTTLCAAMLLCGCTTIEQAQRSVRGIFRPLSVAPATPAAKRADQITQEELEQLTYGFSDRYLTYIITATESIERDKPNAAQRRRAHQVRLADGLLGKLNPAALKAGNQFRQNHWLETNGRSYET